MAPVRLVVILALTLTVSGAREIPDKQLSILLEFRDGYSAQSVGAMQREVERVFQNAPIRLAWVSRTRAISGVAGSLAVIRFRGACRFQAGVPAPPKAAELAVTLVSDGAVLPFSDVACDRIDGFIKPVIRGLDPTKADMLFGRAMGRVVAHEIVHILSRSTQHGGYGVTEPALSVEQLTGDTLPLAWSPWMWQENQPRFSSPVRP